MVRLMSRVPNTPLASVAWTVKPKVPFVVGVPDSTPSVPRVSPGGSVPAVWVHVNGAAPPVAANAMLFGTPTVVGGSGLAVVITGAGAIVIASDRVAVAPAPSRTCAVKL